MRRSSPRAAASMRREPPLAGAGGPWGVGLALALVGIGVSGYLTVSAYQALPPVCLVGACAEVAASRYSRFLGLPTAAWGLLLYLVVAPLFAAGLRGAPRPWITTALFGLCLFGASFSLYLIWLQVAVLRAVCALCAASAALWLLLLPMAWVLIRRHTSAA